jgi:hypothetical protein
MASIQFIAHKGAYPKGKTRGRMGGEKGKYVHEVKDKELKEDAREGR